MYSPPIKYFIFYEHIYLVRSYVCFYFNPFTIDDDIISVEHHRESVLITIHEIRPNLKIWLTLKRHFTMVFDDEGNKYSCHFDGTEKQFKKSVEFVLKQHDGIL